ADHARLAAEQELNGIALALHASASVFAQYDLIAGDVPTLGTVRTVIGQHELRFGGGRDDQVDQVVIDYLTLSWIGDVVRTGDRARHLLQTRLQPDAEIRSSGHVQVTIRWSHHLAARRSRAAHDCGFRHPPATPFAARRTDQERAHPFAQRRSDVIDDGL